MSYKKAHEVLPRHLLAAVQRYVDGEYIYIPRKEENRLAWGAKTKTRESLRLRNRDILARHLAGCSAAELAEHYFLSTKAIYKILNAAKGG